MKTIRSFASYGLFVKILEFNRINIRCVPDIVTLAITLPALSRWDGSSIGEELGFISFRPLSEKK